VHALAYLEGWKKKREGGGEGEEREKFHSLLRLSLLEHRKEEGGKGDKRKKKSYHGCHGDPHPDPLFVFRKWGLRGEERKRRKREKLGISESCGVDAAARGERGRGKGKGGEPRGEPRYFLHLTNEALPLQTGERKKKKKEKKERDRSIKYDVCGDSFADFILFDSGKKREEKRGRETEMGHNYVARCNTTSS